MIKTNNKARQSIKSLDDENERIIFGTKDALDTVDLIEIQKNAWSRFLDKGIHSLLHEFFPIEDYTKRNFSLELEGITYGEPKYTLTECLEKKLTYHFPISLKVKLINKKKNVEKKQDVYFFTLPKMTSRGTFIINGIERAVISQIVRSPGVYFTAEIDKTTGATVYNAEIRPYIGSWIDFAISKNNIIEAKINKKRKFLATSFIRAFTDLSDQNIIDLFSDLDKELVSKFIVSTLNKDSYKTKDEAVIDMYRKLKPGEPLILKNAYDTLQNLFFNVRRYSLADVGRYKVNKKLQLSVPVEKENFIIKLEDIIGTIKYLINLTVGKGQFD